MLTSHAQAILRVVCVVCPQLPSSAQLMMAMQGRRDDGSHERGHCFCALLDMLAGWPAHRASHRRVRLASTPSFQQRLTLRRCTACSLIPLNAMQYSRVSSSSTLVCIRSLIESERAECHCRPLPASLHRLGPSTSHRCRSCRLFHARDQAATRGAGSHSLRPAFARRGCTDAIFA